MTINRREENKATVLAAIKEWYKSYDFGPSYRDLSRPDGLTDISLGTVYVVCQELREDGKIEFDEGRARSIRLLRGRR